MRKIFLTILVSVIVSSGLVQAVESTSVNDLLQNVKTNSLVQQGIKNLQLDKNVQEQGASIVKRVYSYLNEKLYPAEKNRGLFDWLWQFIRVIPQKFMDILKKFS